MARHLLADEEDTIDSVFSWECAVLFTFFVLITLAWEFGTALLAYLTVFLSGRKAIWLQRIKGEILALGIITLMLTVLTSSLEHICISQDTPRFRRSLLAGGSAVDCPDGTRQLFSATLIHDTHILLFTVAIVHIIISCGSFYLSLARMRFWRSWEKKARSGYELEVEEEMLVQQLGGSNTVHTFLALRNTLVSSVTEPMYNLLRILFKLRIDNAVTRPEDKLPKHYNFLNVVEQSMEVDFSDSSGTSVVMFLFMAVFLVIPRQAHGIYILTLISLVTNIAVAAKYQSIVVQLGACTLFDFSDEVRLLQHHKGKFLPRIGTVRSSITGNEQRRRTRDDGSKRSKTSLELASQGAIAEAQEAGSSRTEDLSSKPGGDGAAEDVAGHDMLMEEQGQAQDQGQVQEQVQEQGWQQQGHVAGRNGCMPVSPAGIFASGAPDVKTNIKAGGICKVHPEPAGQKGGSIKVLTKGLIPELEALRSQCTVNFRDPDNPLQLKRECYQAFWFNSPRFLLFIFQLAWCETSLAITLIVFGLTSDGAKFAKEEGVWLVCLGLIVNVMIVIYSSIAVHPVAAIVNTVGTDNPAKLVREIKKQKLVAEEEYEEGLGGMMLKFCLCHKEHGEEHELDGAHLSFIRMLADQAGVIASANNHSSGESGTKQEVLDLYRGFCEMWIQRSKEHRHPELALVAKEKHPIICNLTGIRSAFHLIDRNHSGTISSSELAAVLKAMGTRATAEELRDMVDEIDTNGTDSIEFTEFCLFLVFKFFDPDRDGFVDRQDIQATLNSLGMDGRTDRVEHLIDYCLDKVQDRVDPRRLVHLSEFIHVFSESVELIHSEGAPSAAPTEHSEMNR